MKWAYYNEIDPFAAEWLKNLMKNRQIMEGEIDTRSISKVLPADVAGFRRCHFFAGIGGWDYALRLAGWPDDSPVWTGSCPCQPFSSAGKQKGHDDERHLWPEWFRLIRECRPPTLFGEQVANSLTFGKPVARGKDVQQMLDRKAIIDVLQASKWLFEGGLQRLRELSTFLQEEEDLSGRQNKLQRENSCGSGQISSQQNEFAICVRCGRDTGKDRQRSMRTYGNTLRSEESESVEHPFIGSDYSGGRIYQEKYSSNSLLCKCDVPELGSGFSSENGGCDTHEAFLKLSGLIGKDRAKSDEKYAQDWLSLVFSNLGEIGYSCWASVISAAGVGAPHIRQRLWFVADTQGERGDGRSEKVNGPATGSQRGYLHQSIRSSEVFDRMADSIGIGWGGGRDGDPTGNNRPLQVEGRGPFDLLGNTERTEKERLGEHGREVLSIQEAKGPGLPSISNFWSDCGWVWCRDGKYRPVESPPVGVADGIPDGMGLVRHGDRFVVSTLIQKSKNRVGRLKGYGNAIVPQVAAAFIQAYLGKEGK